MNPTLSSPLESPAALMNLLEAWVRRGWLRGVDLAFTAFLLDEAPDADPLLLLAAALASHQLGRGHVCLDLHTTLEDPYRTLSLPPEGDETAEPDRPPLPGQILSRLDLESWCARLKHPSLISAGEGDSPLVMTGRRLYLRRYWHHERSVESALCRRLALRERITRELPEAGLRHRLSLLFPREQATGPETTDWQKVACALAARSAFSIITGGPGTGKTTTVVRLLALLQSLALGEGRRPLYIHLAAPTGKAAARLGESISGAIDRLPPALLAQEGLRAAIPSEVTTLHRLLGTTPGTRQFRHHARNPLELDLLVVDEASMVDLEMMASLLSALPDRARLVLLGDKDQLASVEAGSVLGELCRRAEAGHYDADTLAWLERETGEGIDGGLADEGGTPLDQGIVMLRQSHRFTATSGIGRLAQAVREGNLPRIGSLWEEGSPDLERLDLRDIRDSGLDGLVSAPAAAPEGRQGYAHYLSVMRSEQPPLEAPPTAFDAWAIRVLAAHGRFQILSALRRGPHGVAGLNERIAGALYRQGLITPTTPWYPGRPVLMTRNDYGLGLMNGDIGIALPYPREDRESGRRQWGLRVAFPRGEAGPGIRWVLPSRLQAVETVFALTVHKSQGSEFEHCALILPPEAGPVLTRELVYTGITRAKRWFSLVTLGNPGILIEASRRVVQRSGGLFDS